MTLTGAITTNNATINGYTNPPTAIQLKHASILKGLSMRYSNCVLGVLVFETSSLLYGQCRESVSGIVVDEFGHTVSGAFVTIHSTSLSPGHHFVKEFETSTAGAFAGTVEGIGAFIAVAKKPLAGYPEAGLAFYATTTPQILQLTCQQAVSGLVVKLSPKAASIKTVTALSGVNGAPIQNASITLQRVASPDVFVTISTSYANIAVPAGVDVQYEISAPGYTTSSPQLLRLTGADAISISITLFPSS